ncbi:MAG: hypothetical protein AB8F94_02690 [Saprospiraceae bacterium]
MLLDDQLPIFQRYSPTKKVDWLFSLTGFFFMFFSLACIFFYPEKVVGLFLDGNLIITPFYFVWLGATMIFFTFGGLYAFINRGLKIKTDYKMGILHLVFSLLTVIVLLWKVSDESLLIEFSIYDVFNSIISLMTLLILAQMIFFVNAFLGMIRRYDSKF